jgi:hypothetical protein
VLKFREKTKNCKEQWTEIVAPAENSTTEAILDQL